MISRGKNSSNRGAIPPQDLEAEKCVIGSAMFDPDCIDAVSAILTPACFFGHSNRVLWQCLVGMRNSGQTLGDVVILANQLNSSGLLEEIGGAAYLNEVMEAVPHAAHAEYYARIVRDKSQLRAVIEQAEEIAESAYAESDDCEGILVQSQQRIADLIEKKSGGNFVELYEVLMDAIDSIENGQSNGLATGFAELDQVTTGMHPGQLIVVAARPGMGKTAFALSMAMNVSHGGTGVLFFSMEMDKREIGKRILGIDTMVPVKDMCSGQLDQDQRHKLVQSPNTMFDRPIYLVDSSSITISQISSTARMCSRVKQIGLIVVDYLGLIDAEDKKIPREQQVSGITRAMKILARSLGIPVVLLSQLNRDVEKRKDKRPLLSELRESGAIEQDADQVWMLHRQELYEEKDSPEWHGWHNVAEVLVRKCRNSSIGEVKLQFDSPSMAFRNLAPTYLDDPGDGYSFYTQSDA